MKHLSQRSRITSIGVTHLPSSRLRPTDGFVAILGTTYQSAHDINMQGAMLQAQGISLQAKRNINLLAAQNSAVTASQNSGNSFGGGVTVGLGSQNGISFQANAGTSRGRTNGNELSCDNTLISATEGRCSASGGGHTVRARRLN